MVGGFVKVKGMPYREYGIGKVIRVQGQLATITYFDTPDESEPTEITVPLSAILSVDLPAQTRVFRLSPGIGRWQVGRVLDGEGPDILVQFPNKEIANVPRDELQVRWRRPIADPVSFLTREITETPRFAEARSAFMKAVTTQRAACMGMGAVLASRIQLADYQFNVIQRVLQDPVQRYLLADEVGLGKTIEAGTLVRQYFLDAPETARALIIVPAQVVGQWKEELSSRFALEEWLDDFIHVVRSDDLTAVRSHIGTAGMLVVDEAHHLSCRDTPEADALYELLRERTSAIPRLLLLSATPVLADTAGFLRMLHLLDPVVFPLGDLQGFERRLQGRQLVAETVAALVPENMLVLEGELDRLESAFGDDPALVELASRLRPIIQALPDEDDETFLDALDSLRAHLTETYKLHRRILRNRRKSFPWATPRRCGLRLATYTCATTAERSKAQENLRIHLANSDTAVAIQTALFHSALHPTASPKHVELLRTYGPKDDTAFKLAYQVDRLHEQERDEGTRIEAAVSTVVQMLERESLQVVVFCDRASDADTVCSALATALPGHVQRHDPKDALESHDDDDRPDEPWREFLNHPSRCRVLVCDARAEEGLNLHGGRKAVVHFDLPPAANRVEQRLGRLDRFGSGDAVQSVAIVCADDPDEFAWVSCLRDGFQVFDTSMASLQYLVEEAMRLMPARWVGEGTQALADLTKTLSGLDGWVARERRRIDQQDALDALNERPSEAFEVLESVDADWRTWRHAFDAFAVDTLQFHKTQEQWGDPLPSRDQVFRLGYSLDGQHQTLLPLSALVRDFLCTIDTTARGSNARNPRTHRYAFRRNTALSRAGEKAGVRPLRYGDTLIESLCSFCEADDRGRVFAMWRYLPGYEAMDAIGTDLYFRFDYLVEASVDKVATTWRHAGTQDAETMRALHRRADGHLPPEFVSVWVSPDGKTSDEVPEALAESYRKDREPGRGRDFNLNPQRWQLLHMQPDLPWLAAWAQHCQAARQCAQSFVMSLPRVQARIATALNKMQRLHKMRQAQLANRLTRLHGAARQTEERDRDAEAHSYGWLVEAISTPALRLDVVGAIFLSSQTPFGR